MNWPSSEISLEFARYWRCGIGKEKNVGPLVDNTTFGIGSGDHGGGVLPDGYTDCRNIEDCCGVIKILFVA